MNLHFKVHALDGDIWLAPQQYEHPILSPFRSLPTDQLPWNALPVFRYWQVEPLTEKTEIVVPFSDGRAAILTHSVGRGNVLVMTTPISDPAEGKFWNLIPTGEAFWLFLPLADGMARFLIGVENENFNFPAGQLVTLRSGTSRLPGSCVVKPPQGDGLRVTPDQNRGVITYPETDMVGNYQISAGGTLTGDKFQSGFSVNVSPLEWNFSRMDPKRLAELFGDKLHQTRDQAKIEVGMTQSRVGRELFPVLILLLLLFFTLEYLFANRFYGE